MYASGFVNFADTHRDYSLSVTILKKIINDKETDFYFSFFRVT